MTMIRGSDVDEYIGLAGARILRNRSRGFGIRDALCAGESCNTELTTKADESQKGRTPSQSRRNTDNGANLLELPRRDFLAALGTTITVVGIPSCVAARPKREMYGEIGKIIAVSGKRAEVIENILNAISNMPGCLSYIVAKDVSNGDAIWISEVWDSRANHEASLSLPSVKDAIAKNLPLIAGMSDSAITIPVGGHGLSSSKYR